jgi:hypothetical protein
VHFTPLLSPDYPLRWLLSRAPHVSNVPRPSCTFPELPFTKRLAHHPSAWKTLGWSGTKLFDGRYWIRLLHRLPCQLRVAPFEAEHHKPFREALGDEREKRELAALLRRYAPGKTRYTLPGIYAVVDVSGLLKGGEWWPAELPVRPYGQVQTHAQGQGQGQVLGEGGGGDEMRQDGGMAEVEVIDQIRKRGLNGLAAARFEWEFGLKETERLQLLALPTLGIGLPGLDEWVRWEVRYRKVDVELLRLSKLGGRRIGRSELRRRVRYVYWWMRKRRERKGVARRGR